MIKKLIIQNDPNLRLVVNINLDDMNLHIEKKLESLEVIQVFTKQYKIDVDSKLEEIFEEFYLEYLKRKDIELYWKETLKDATFVEFKLDEEKVED